MKIRIRSIYTKLLISFFSLIALEVILILLWSAVFVSTEITDEETFDIEAQGFLMNMALREAARTAPDTPPAKNPRVLTVLKEFMDMYQAQTWLVDAQGTVLYSSTGKKLPDIDKKKTHKYVNMDLMELNVTNKQGDPEFYVVMPTDMGKWGPITLHALFLDTHNASEIGKSILLGQLLVALIIGLLIFPVSRFITTPMRHLQHAVLRYANGNLKSRFTQKRGDEIGELGEAFNVMANNLEDMIRGGRELVANVSHELRSPLARLRISEELIRDKIGPVVLDDSRRHLDSIRDEVNHLDGLIGRMLEITRLDHQEAEKRPELIDLSRLTQRVAARYDAVTEHQNITFIVTITNGVFAIGNEEALASVMTNLLDNAFKYCSSKGTVQLTLNKSATGRILLQVDNTHPPLTPTDLEKMFKPFHRIGTTNQQGYGLGLAIVQKIVHKHGGLISAQNMKENLRLEVSLPPIRDINT